MRIEDDVVARDPFNAETARRALETPVTPTDGFYTRNNFPVPEIAPASWRVALEGFRRPVKLRHADLLARPSVELEVVLECAGNGRTYFDPVPEGTAWRERAVGCARFRGAPLRGLLEEAGIPEGTVEVLFRGADGGKAAFERALPLDVALADDTLVAWEMNGEPLRPLHGAPARLLVPRWYGVASVKWLVEIRALAQPFEGHFQAERYVYQPSPDDRASTPVREKRVNSLVVHPDPGASVREGQPLVVRGWAWSGHGAIARVEVSADDGRTWRDAQLDAAPGVHAWRGWRATLTPPAGEAVLLSRAHDERGNVQPDHPAWNVHGYGYNAPRPRRIRIAPATPA